MHYIEKLMRSLSCQKVSFFYDNVRDNFNMDTDALLLLHVKKVFKNVCPLPSMLPGCSPHHFNIFTSGQDYNFPQSLPGGCQ